MGEDRKRRWRGWVVEEESVEEEEMVSRGGDGRRR